MEEPAITNEVQQEEKTLVAEGMVLQSTTYTCGPAALATLLKMLGSDNNYYEKITQLVQVDQNGSSLLELKHSVEALGYSAAGYRKNIEELAFSGPVLAHVVINDYHHFTVVEGMADGYVFLADPTLGRVSISLEQFKKVWNGIALKVSKKSPVEIMPIDPKGERISETDEYQQTNSDKNKSIETIPLAEVVVISSTDEFSSEAGIAVETPSMLDENDITVHEITDVCRELLEKTKNPTNIVQSAEMLTFTETSGIQLEQAEACILSLKTDTILCLNYEKTVPEKQNESSNEKENFNGEQKSELPEEALIHEIDTLSVEESEKYTTKRLIQSSQLDETEMMSIRGRAIFLVPLAIKAVKLAPAVTSGVQILKKTAMANARSIGIAGERAVGTTGRKMQIKMSNGKIRVPDSIDPTRRILTEVKNVSSLNYTRQLRDYHTFAQNNRLTFELFVRSDTKLSRLCKMQLIKGQ